MIYLSNYIIFNIIYNLMNTLVAELLLKIIPNLNTNESSKIISLNKDIREILLIEN